MSFSRQVPLSSLIELCRVLRHNLSAGLTLLDVFRQQARRGPAAVRPIAERITDRLTQGDDLETALESEHGRFPPLFVSLAVVGEQTGTLPEVFTELERYFLLQQRLRRQFWMQSFWPLFQLFAAIFVIAGMLFVLGILGAELAPLGPFFRGIGGSIRFLALSFGSVAALVALYYLLTRSLGKQAMVHAILLRLPVLGRCMEAIALARFCLCLRLTLETSLPLPKALRLCLRATGNGHFLGQSDRIGQAIRQGDELADALARSRLFPVEFLNIMATAEVSGRLPEVMEQQAEHYSDEAERRLTVLTSMASLLVWLLMAGLLIFLILSIFMRAYLGPLNDVLKTLG